MHRLMADCWRLKADYMIKITNLEKIYRTEEVETMALNKLSFSVKEGEFVAVMGPSGCGKSTLLLRRRSARTRSEDSCQKNWWHFWKSISIIAQLWSRQASLILGPSLSTRMETLLQIRGWQPSLSRCRPPTPGLPSIRICSVILLPTNGWNIILRTIWRYPNCFGINRWNTRSVFTEAGLMSPRASHVWTIGGLAERKLHRG